MQSNLHHSAALQGTPEVIRWSFPQLPAKRCVTHKLTSHEKQAKAKIF